MGTGTWSDQLARAERYLVRFEHYKTKGVPSPLIHHAVDDVYSFFVHCYHVEDYLRADPIFKQADPVAWRKDTEALTICRDICTGIKHVTCDSVPKPAIFGTQLVKITTGDGGNPPAPTSTFAPTIEYEGESRDGLETAQAAVAAWRKFIEAVQGGFPLVSYRRARQRNGSQSR